MSNTDKVPCWPYIQEVMSLFSITDPVYHMTINVNYLPDKDSSQFCELESLVLEMLCSKDYHFHPPKLTSINVIGSKPIPV